MKCLLLLLVACGSLFGQSYVLAFTRTATTGISIPMRGAAVNQFHQLTVIAYDKTAGSCSAGWTGVIYLRGSQDNVTYTQMSISITSVAQNAVAYTSAAGSFAYVDVDYVSGSTSTCAISAWYSGTNTGYPAFNTPLTPAAPIQIAGNTTLLSGQQSVTTSAVALATHATKQVCVKNNDASTQSVFIGPAGVTTTTGQELLADEAVCLPVANTNLIFVVAAMTGATVSWAGTN